MVRCVLLFRFFYFLGGCVFCGFWVWFHIHVVGDLGVFRACLCLCLCLAPVGGGVYFGYILRTSHICSFTFHAQNPSFLHLPLFLGFWMSGIYFALYSHYIRIYDSHAIYAFSVSCAESFFPPPAPSPSFSHDAFMRPGNFGISIYYEVQPQTEKYI